MFTVKEKKQMCLVPVPNVRRGYSQKAMFRLMPARVHTKSHVQIDARQAPCPGAVLLHQV